MTTFAALYVIFSFWNIFPVIGAEGKWITAATVTSPLIGLILGPYVGSLAVIVGGVVAAFVSSTGVFGPFSFIPHLAATFCAGMLSARRQTVCIIVFTVFLVVFAFFPVVGPVWLSPIVLWLDIIGLFVLASPLQYKAITHLNEATFTNKLSLGVGITCFTSTLFGHVVGSLMFAAMNWPNATSLKAVWEGTAWVYPVERITITIFATIIGVTLLKTLKNIILNRVPLFQ
jgi:hypothetical protein